MSAAGSDARSSVCHSAVALLSNSHLVLPSAATPGGVRARIAPHAVRCAYSTSATTSKSQLPWRGAQAHRSFGAVAGSRVRGGVRSYVQ